MHSFIYVPSITIDESALLCLFFSDEYWKRCLRDGIVRRAQSVCNGHSNDDTQNHVTSLRRFVFANSRMQLLQSQGRRQPVV